MFKALLVVVTMLMINQANATGTAHDLDINVCVVDQDAAGASGHCFNFSSQHSSEDSCKAKESAVLQAPFRAFIPDANGDGRADTNATATRHWTESPNVGTSTGNLVKWVHGGCFPRNSSL